MLVLRNEQLEAIAEVRFREWLALHTQQFFPDACDRLGKGRPAFLDDGVARARRYGFTRHADITKFVDLMLALGPDFDRDPELPWAREILTDSLVPGAEARMDELHTRAVRHLNDVETSSGAADQGASA